MARIVLTTFGSSGDINPFVALALGLRARNHDVLFAIEDNFRVVVEQAGFSVAHLSGDAMAAMREQSLDLLRDTNPFRSVRALVRDYIVPTTRPRIEDLRAACVGANLLVASPFQVAAAFVHDLTGIPLVTVTLSPVTIPSAQVNPAPQQFGLPNAVEPLVNRVTWGVGLALMGAFFDPPINRIRAEYQLPPLRQWMYTGKEHWSPRTALAVSRAFFTPPPDLPQSVSVTGFLYWDTPTDWREPPELAAFFADGAPVVAVSSGSMSEGLGGVFSDFYQTTVAAAHAAGARALILGAAPGALPTPLPDGALAMPWAPFSDIYPRCAAIIHHGGIGTTAQGLRAGTPALIAPWGVDQFYAGAQVEAIGAGRWLQRKRYTVERATPLLDALLHQEQYRRRAQEIAARIAQEDGVAALCDLLEDEMARQRAQNRVIVNQMATPHQAGPGSDDDG
jgi:UDP:flavonoid glycosyltransferase YjiC (YdhE family)